MMEPDLDDDIVLLDDNNIDGAVVDMLHDDNEGNALATITQRNCNECWVTCFGREYIELYPVKNLIKYYTTLPESMCVHCKHEVKHSGHMLRVQKHLLKCAP